MDFWNDPRTAYKGAYFIDADSTWSNDIGFTNDYVTITADECITLYNVNTGKWTTLGNSRTETHAFKIVNTTGNTITIGYKCTYDNAKNYIE
jgi:hypothetical protein